MKEKEIERLKKLKEFEENLYHQGIQTLAGIDEAGRGPLAGPVVVGIVIMKPESFIEGVNDSKKLSEKKREMLYEKITEEAIDWAVRNSKSRRNRRNKHIKCNQKSTKNCHNKLKNKTRKNFSRCA